jgi:tetratricopeptide (TPR) repeat protein
MLQVLLGNVTLAQCVDQMAPGPPPLLDPGLVSRAESYYRRALELDPGYARAHVGLGETLYLEAVQKCVPDKIDVPKMDEAIDQFRLARASTEDSFLANVEAKAAFGLGRSYLCLLYAGKEGYSMDDAEGELRRVIDEYQGGNALVADWAREAHIELGILYSQLNSQTYPAKYQTSAQHFVDAIQVGISAKKIGVRVKFACAALGSVEAHIADEEALPSRATSVIRDAACSDQYEQALQQETQRLQAGTRSR